MKPRLLHFLLVVTFFVAQFGETSRPRAAASDEPCFPVVREWDDAGRSEAGEKSLAASGVLQMQSPEFAVLLEVFYPALFFMDRESIRLRGPPPSWL